MSKVRDLPEITTLANNDLFYVVDESAGTNGGRKIKKENLTLPPEDHAFSHRPGGSDELNTEAPDSIDADGLNLEGNSLSFARSDHKHNVLTGPPTEVLTPSSVNFEGISPDLARADHTHEVATAQLVNISAVFPNATAFVGTIDKYARADHRHNVSTAGPVSQPPDQANAEGISESFSRADHLHNIPTANVSTIGTTNIQGTADTFALSDHIHNHGVQASPTLHAAVTTTDNGFMLSSDKSKLDTLVFGYLSYTNVGAQSTTQNNTAFTAVIFDSDTGSFANSLLTKSSSTQFRTDFNGYIRVSYKLRAQDTSSNDTGWRTSVLKNGTEILHTRVNTVGKTNAERHNSSSGSFTLACATNDLFTIGFGNAEAATTDTITIVASGASVNVHAMYKTS